MNQNGLTALTGLLSLLTSEKDKAPEKPKSMREMVDDARAAMEEERATFEAEIEAFRKEMGL